MEIGKLLQNVDWWIFLPVVFLLILGSVVGLGVAPTGLSQHLFYMGVSVFLFFLLSNIDARILRQFSHFFYLICLALLLATLVFAPSIRGATRWISIASVAFQPSEIVKPLLLLFWASIICSSRNVWGLVKITMAFVPPFLLIFLQPDLGSSLVLLAGFFGTAFFGGVPIRLLGAALGAFGAVLPLTWRFLASYQKERILSFLYPTSDPLGAGYNSIQAVIAVGSGSLLGRGLGQGTQSQLAFLPERHTDFVFASLSEDLGFFSSVVVIVLFGVILLRIIVALKHETDGFYRAFLGGAFFIMFSHIVINIGMNLGVLPITGIPLPFISSGGSALVGFSIMLAVVSGISSKLKRRGGLDILRV